MMKLAAQPARQIPSLTDSRNLCQTALKILGTALFKLGILWLSNRICDLDEFLSLPLTFQYFFKIYFGSEDSEKRR